MVKLKNMFGFCFHRTSGKVFLWARKLKKGKNRRNLDLTHLNLGLFANVKKLED